MYHLANISNNLNISVTNKLFINRKNVDLKKMCASFSSIVYGHGGGLLCRIGLFMDIPVTLAICNLSFFFFINILTSPINCVLIMIGL